MLIQEDKLALKDMYNDFKRALNSYFQSNLNILESIASLDAFILTYSLPLRDVSTDFKDGFSTLKKQIREAVKNDFIGAIDAPLKNHSLQSVEVRLRNK